MPPRPVEPRPVRGRTIIPFALSTLLAALLGAPACRDGEPDAEDLPRPRATVLDTMPAAAPDTIPEAASAPEPARYVRVPIPGPAALAALADSLGAAGMHLVLRVNRLDLAHVRKGDSLIVPGLIDAGDTLAADSLACSPFPPALAAADSVPKLLLIANRVQAFAGYEYGQLVRWGPTSTGRRDMPTPVGLYHVNWQDKERTSTFNDEWLLRWCSNLDNVLGTSIHEYALPGRPASHSCVRLLEADARWFYHWAEQWQLSADGREVLVPGTPVVVFGEYAFGQRPPWKLLPEEPAAATLSAAEMDSALGLYQRAAGPAMTSP